MKTHVLLVDEDADLTVALADLLERRGYRVTVANDGAQAIAALDTLLFDIVLLDLVLPELDGLETLEWMRRTGYPAAVLVLADRGAGDLAAVAIRLGAYDCVRKPCEIGEIVEKLELGRTLVPPS
jgi:DNA-binding response OmpR family regulator